MNLYLYFIEKKSSVELIKNIGRKNILQPYLDMQLFIQTIQSIYPINYFVAVNSGLH